MQNTRKQNISCKLKPKKHQKIQKTKISFFFQKKTQKPKAKIQNRKKNLLFVFKTERGKKKTLNEHLISKFFLIFIISVFIQESVKFSQKNNQ
jgi:hypothetical protein